MIPQKNPTDNRETLFDFRIATHMIKEGTNLVEILRNGEIVGAIYPTSKGIKIVSKHFLENDLKSIIEIDNSPPVPAILINF